MMSAAWRFAEALNTPDNSGFERTSGKAAQLDGAFARPVLPQRRSVPGMEPATLVSLLIARDPAGLAKLYDAYAPRLHDYCAWLVSDRDTAGDVLHDSLLIAAQRADQLRDPSRLKPWLYSIARNECLRLLRQRQRVTELPAFDQLIDDSVDVDAGLRAEQAHVLVRDAATTLGEREREVINLALRHDFAGDEIGAALGVSNNHAHALLSRAKGQLEKAITALVLAKVGSKDCAVLAQLVGGGPTVTSVVRKRVNRHVDLCQTCGETKRKRLAPAAMFTALPIIALPGVLRKDLLARYRDPNLVSYRAALAERAEPFADTGFPAPLGGRRAGAGVLVAAGIVLVVALLGVALWQADSASPSRFVTEDNIAPFTAPISPSESSSVPSSSPPLAGSSRTPSSSPLASPMGVTPRVAPAGPQEAVASAGGPTVMAAVPVVVLQVRDLTAECGRWNAEIVVTVTEAVARSVSVAWSGKPGIAELSPAGDGRWSIVVEGIEPGRIVWEATATTADGVTGQSETTTTSHPSCPAT